LLACGYVMGVHGALVAGIPGLKSETWGTLRVFPTRRIEAIMYGLMPGRGPSQRVLLHVQKGRGQEPEFLAHGVKAF
jgi:hypothetical protein